MLIDFHCHRTAPFAVTCTDTPSSGPAPAAEPSALLSCQGLLPGRWNAELQDMLLSNLISDSGLQMGEVGLDRRFKDVLPMDRQTEILRTMLHFAVEHDKSISLHCVQATEVMLNILRESSFRPHGVLWHGFTGSRETAAVLSGLKVIVSIGPRFRGNLLDIFEANRALVPETDYEGSDPAEHESILKAQYDRFSRELQMTPDEILGHTEKLFKAFSPNPGC